MIKWIKKQWHEVKQFMEKNMGWFRKQWKKFVDWVFKDFY
jgi:hypothetical protein